MVVIIPYFLFYIYIYIYIERERERERDLLNKKQIIYSIFNKKGREVF
jgi:hypothetical protein